MNKWFSDPALIILVGLAFVLGVGMIFERIQKYRSSKELTQKGIVAQGKIVRRWSIDVSSNYKPAWSRGWRNDYYVSYQYEVETLDGNTRIFTKKQDVKKNIYYQLRVGDIVNIIYLPSTPDKSKIAF